MSGGHKGSMKMSLVLLTLSMLATTGWSIPYPAEQVPTVTTQNQTSSTTPSPDLTGDRFNEFDWKLCKALVETEHGNIVISPISLKLVLVMIYEGANGNTAQELATVLGLSREDMGRQLTRTKFSNIVGALKSSKGEYDLNLGTSIFIDRSVTPKPSYVRKLQSFYEAQIEQVDFSKTPEAIKAINAWAAYSTKGQIQNFLSEGDASASTILMLLNAIYFKGQWMYTFPSNQTAPGIFYAGGKKPINVNYMNTVNYYYYMDAPEINAQVIRLPYLGNKLAMYFIIPNNRTGLPELVNKIDPFVLRKHTQNMYENLVELSLPSFKIDFTAYLGPILTKLGIKKMFSNGAELNEIAEVSNNSIAVSNVLQKAGIQVNEEGSTAFAATEGEVINKFGDSTVVLKLDHPFLFFIKDEKTDTVLFVGNLVNPNPSNDAVNPDNVKTTTPVTPDNVKTTITPVTPATETNKTTAKPEPANPSNNGTPDIEKLVQVYFLKEAISDELKEVIKSHYLSGTTSYDLEKALELYIILKDTSRNLKHWIEYYFSIGFTAKELQELIKLNFLMEIKSEELDNFINTHFIKGYTSKDIEVLTKFFVLKDVAPEVVAELIKHYNYKKQNFT